MIGLVFDCALISCYLHVHLNYGPELLFFFFFEAMNYAAICYLYPKKQQVSCEGLDLIWALFSSIFFYKIDTVAFSFVFDKYYPIMD